MKRRAIFKAMILAGLFAIAVGCTAIDEDGNKEVGQVKVDLENHPIYSKYEFSQDEKVIELGDQPLWTTSSVITEYMLRDTILKKELDTLGYSFKMHHFLKGNDINHFLFKGDLEAGVAGDMPTLRAASVDDKVVVVSLIQEGPVSIISRNIKEVENLKGKKIGYALGSNAHFYLLDTLAKHGINESEVKLVQMDVDTMAVALYKNKIDAFSAWEMTPTLALSKYPTFTVTHRGRSYGFLYVRKELMQKSPEAVYQLLASEIRALRWLKENERNIEIAAKWMNDTVAKISPSSTPLLLGEISAIMREDLPGMHIMEYPRISMDLLTENGPLKKEFEFLKYLDLIPKDKKWIDTVEKFDSEAIEVIISNPNKYKIYESEID